MGKCGGCRDDQGQRTALAGLIQAGMDNNNMTQILAGIIMIGVVGFLLAYIMRKAEEVMCRWNKSGR